MTEGSPIQTQPGEPAAALADATGARAFLATVRPQIYGSGAPDKVLDPLVEPLWVGIRALAAVDAAGAIIVDDEGEPVANIETDRRGARRRRPGDRRGRRWLPDQADDPDRGRRLPVVGRVAEHGLVHRAAPQSGRRHPGPARGGARGEDLQGRGRGRLRRHGPALARRHVAPRRPAPRAAPAARERARRIGRGPARGLRPSADRLVGRLVEGAGLHRPDLQGGQQPLPARRGRTPIGPSAGCRVADGGTVEPCPKPHSRRPSATRSSGSAGPTSWSASPASRTPRRSATSCARPRPGWSSTSRISTRSWSTRTPGRPTAPGASSSRPSRPTTSSRSSWSGRPTGSSGSA